MIDERKVMLKAFLSYSRKQKGYTEIVAKNLGKSNIIFDIWTFEEGNKTIDEIFQGLSETGVFVLLLSNEALESKWVKTEIENTYKMIKDGNIKRLYPIIIDENIKYDDKRIPQWIQENYSLKYVSKPTKASERIKQILKTLSWKLYPKNKELSQLFIGRTELIKKYEERIFNYEKLAPTTMITTGLPSIGRRKFTLHCLKNSNKIREYYTPPIIFLGSRSSIEDLIISLYDLGFSQMDRKELFTMLKKTIEEKVTLAAKLLLEIELHEAIIFIIDSYSIVGQDGYIVNWYKEIIEHVKGIDRLFICLISRRKIRAKQLISNDYIFVIEMPELEKYERNALFSSLLDLEKFQIKKQDLNTICELFSGFPEQIFFTFEILLSEGLPYLMSNLYLIPDYNSEKIDHVVRKYQSNDCAIQVLGFLSNVEFVSLNFLEKIFEEDFQKIIPLIEEFSNCFIIEFIGATKEYFRLNDAIRDNIQRTGIGLNEKYTKNLENHAQSNFEEYDIFDRDMSDYVITIKEALKRGCNIPEKLLLPSHILNAMRDLYVHEGRFDYVIKLADRVLLQEKHIDERILREVRYWLCLSLARKRNKRMIKEVQKIEGPDHNFLLGFYYRLTGKHNFALERLENVLERSPKFYRAKRELVQIYINLEEYDKAFDLAKENYKMLKNNPYNLHSYFRCLIKNSKISPKDKKDELNVLLMNLKNNLHEKAKEMFMTSNAQYIATIENNERRALDIVDEAIATFPKSIYPQLTRIEICRKFDDRQELEYTIRSIENAFQRDSEIFVKLVYLSTKALIIARKGDVEASLRLINGKVKSLFPESIYNKIKEEINHSSS